MLDDINIHIINRALWNYYYYTTKVLAPLTPTHVGCLLLKGDKEVKGSSEV